MLLAVIPLLRSCAAILHKWLLNCPLRPTPSLSSQRYKNSILAVKRTPISLRARISINRHSSLCIGDNVSKLEVRVASRRADKDT